MYARLFVAALLAVSTIFAQDGSADQQPGALSKPAPAAGDYVIAPGTKVPLSLINTISTKHSVEGDRVYLETSFPVLANGRIVVPVGSYVAGTITDIKKPGRAKGRGELFIRFDSLTLPNGVTREFRARLGGVDGQASGELDRAEGRVKSEGNKAGDVRTVAETASAGTSVGAIAGSVAGHTTMGLGIGAAAGAAAGLIGVLVTRGPDAVLPRGSTVEMLLDRPISFEERELDFGNYQPPRLAPATAPAPESSNKSSVPLPGRKIPK
jgi:hypothetical protein